MKLDNKEFKEFLALEKLIKAKKATDAEVARYNELLAKKNEKGSNDPKWWLNYPKLAKDVTNLAFNVIPGTSQYLGDNMTNVPVPLKNGLIAIAQVVPTIGRCRSDADAFNVQIRQLWLDMHRKYRGIGTYEKSDLGIIILAINQAFATLAKFERIYGVINTYKVANRSVPYGLMEALHISPDLEEHLADFRYMLNLYVTKMQGFCLPKGMSALESDIVTLSNIFKDCETERAGLFAFDTTVYAVYNPSRFTSGGCVEYKQINSHMSGTTRGGRVGFTLLDIRTIMEEIVNALLSDDDVARVCSDLLAAYGSNNVQTLLPIEADYKVIPTHDYERKLQFHNLTRCGEVDGMYVPGLETTPGTNIDATYIQNMYAGDRVQYCVYQFDNEIISELCCSLDPTGYISHGGHIVMGNGSWQTNDMARAHECILDFWVDEPSMDDILVGTRFTSLADPLEFDGGSSYVQVLKAFGTFVCQKVQVFSMTAGAWRVDISGGSAQNITAYNFSLECALNEIDWRPFTYVQDNGVIQLVGDLDNWTRVNEFNLSRIHEVCLLSGYVIPMVAKE